MSTITYACINDGHRKLVEFPPRTGALEPIADSLQTVLTTVPPGEQIDFREVEDSDYIYYYSSQATNKFLAGCACRRMPGNNYNSSGSGNSTTTNNNSSSNNNVSSTAEVRAFLKDALKLIPNEAGKIAVIDEAKIKEIQQLLKARLEASTDRKLADVNAAIEKARLTMERNIEQALARDEHLRTMEENSNVITASSAELQRSTEQLNWKFMKERVKTAMMVLGVIAVVVVILAMMVCHPDFSNCKSATTSSRASAATKTTTAPTATSNNIIIIGGSGK